MGQQVPVSNVCVNRFHTQVLLRERCLLLVSGEAYTHFEHSIATRTKDVVGAACCNAVQV